MDSEPSTISEITETDVASAQRDLVSLENGKTVDHPYV